MRGLILGALAVVGCQQPTDATESIGEQLSDFSLEDVNATSATVGANISPRDHQGMATAWYFGHAT
ncbi:MAG: hypothetical protein ACI8S6_001235 [Myxococcota bacterium]|jgi:hypothetical protein